MIPIVTSIAPSITRLVQDKRHDIGQIYQAQCVESWIAAGFNVISVNAVDEAEVIAVRYPGISVKIASRDERQRFGRPLIGIQELLSVLRQSGQPFGGIINSDILLPCPSEMRTLVSSLQKGEFAYIKRQDVLHLTERHGVSYSFGIDVFIFDVALTDHLDMLGMTLGVPWWDYYLPLAVLLNGGSLVEWPETTAHHLWHDQKWEQALWQEYYFFFREKFETDLATLVLEDNKLRNPLLLYGLAQSSYYFRHYSKNCVGYDLGRTNELKPKDIENHIVAYGYFVLDFLKKMSRRPDRGEVKQ